MLNHYYDMRIASKSIIGFVFKAFGDTAACSFKKEAVIWQNSIWNSIGEIEDFHEGIDREASKNKRRLCILYLPNK